MLGDDLDPHLLIGIVLIGFVAGLGTATTVPVHQETVHENITNNTTTNVTVYAEELDTVEGYFRCTCGDGTYTYKKYRKWLNYCPMCHRYGTLEWNPKGADGGEFTCSICGADFCGQDGNNKDGGWSGTQLTAA